MKFHDLQTSDLSEDIDADICIVGAGPAGLSIAGEFAGTGKNVWIIESGGLTIESTTQTLYDYENIGVQRCIDQSLIRVRAYGGTSQLWSGRVAPYDEMDFAKRDWIPYSGWPITRDELNPYFERAGQVLGLGPNIYDDRLWERFNTATPKPDIDPNTLRSQFWQFSRSQANKEEPVRFHSDFNPPDSDNLSVLLHANVLHINLDRTESFAESLDISTLGGRRIRVRTNIIILCCGGIENARLMLSSSRQKPMGLGNQNDMVGRFFMEHGFCEIGEFDASESKRLIDRFGHYWVDDNIGKAVYLHGLSLGFEAQRHEKLLNCTVYLVPDSEIDAPWHALKRAYASIIRGRIDKGIPGDLWKSFRGIDRIIEGLARRLFLKRPPIFMSKRVALGCNVEQLPDPDSRVTLSHQKDSLGVPRARVSWKISEKERETVARMAELIGRELTSIGLPKMRPSQWINGETNWRLNFFDSAHHMGTTRMSSCEKEGVVDANCKVHGIEGLYVAGSSVFPTAGTANPMLMIVALAIRLADHLRIRPA